MAKWEDGLREWRGGELSLAHKQHFRAQEIALPPDMAPLRYLCVVYAKARGDGEGAGWKSCFSAVGPLRTINHSLLDGQREEGGRRNSSDSICPHLCYNGLINGRGIVSVFGVVPVLLPSSAPSRDGELFLSFQTRQRVGLCRHKASPFFHNT